MVKNITRENEKKHAKTEARGLKKKFLRVFVCFRVCS